MPRRFRLAAPLVVLMLAGAPLLAQTSAPSTGAPVVGLANLSLGAGIGSYPSGTQWSADFGYRPFVSDHLQLGGGVSYGGSNGPYGREFGTVTASGRYLFGANPRSAPYFAAAVSVNAGQQQPGAFAAEASVGWLQFFTPLTAVDARLSVDHHSASSQTGTTLSVSPSTFIPGLRAALRASAPPTTGSFDWAGSANVGLSPHRNVGAGVQYAPFLTSVFQVGIGAGVAYTPAQSGVGNSVSTYTGTLMGRAYYPDAGLLQPFVELYGSDQSGKAVVTSQVRVHGASIGARHYLSPALALDLRLQRETTDNVFGQFGGQPDLKSHATRTVFSAGLVLHQPHG